MERHDKRFDRLEHKVNTSIGYAGACPRMGKTPAPLSVNQLGSKLDIIIEYLTSINDLPEE